MRLAVLAFAIAVLGVARLPALAAWPAIAIAFAAAMVAAVLAPRCDGASRRVTVAAAAALAGFAWASAYGQWRVADRLAPDLEGRDIVIIGVIASLPQPFERGVRFELDVESARLADGEPVSAPCRVSLSWFNGYSREDFQTVQPVRAGERWRLAVRLKRPHGNANPFGFDFEGWLTERGIGATGYVRPKGPRERLDAFVPRPAYFIERAREDARRRFLEALPDGRYTGVLVALAVGDQRAILSQDWDVFTRTGIGHLMSISGLHVTMVSGLFAALVG